MMTNRNSAIAEKRDLHVGGLGANASAGRRRMQPWVHRAKARNAVDEAKDYVRDNTWTAVGIAAFIGLAAGYVLFRRS
jgi:ElaB/YqjD/DUF883 family membrane-anchored ribosome-binding protein